MTATTQPDSIDANDGTSTIAASMGDHESEVVRPHKRRRVAEEDRRRAARACTRCRRLKEKCDGQHPCQRCFKTSQPCEFTAAEPSASTSHHVAASALVQGNQDGDERVQHLEKLVSHLLGDVPMDLSSLRRISDRISSSQRPGTEWDDLDSVTLEHENFTVKKLSQSTAHYSGEFSHWNFSQKIRQKLVQSLGTALPTQEANAIEPTTSQPDSRNREFRGKKQILEYWRATQLQSPKSLVTSVIGCLPPRHVAKFLVQTYFRFAQTNCFYVQEQWLESKLSILYETPGNVASGDAAWICAVLMVLAIGTQFAHMAAGPLSATLSKDFDDETNTEEDIGLTFYQTAAKLIPDIITIASLESVQACLLLAHYALPLDTQGLAYTYLGLSIKMAIQNGMHRKYGGGDLDAWTIETRNRLWWTAYTVERRVSVLHGRPASISPTEMDADLPKDTPEFRQGKSGYEQFSNMSALIDMTIRLSEASNAISLLRKCPKSLQATYFERILEIWQKLHTWWLSLPDEVQRPSSESAMFRSNVHLKLCFHLVEIFIGRPFIFTNQNEASPRADTPQSQLTSRPSRRIGLINGAMEAAFDIINLCKSLYEITGLARASYTEFSSCRAALLLLLAQSLRDYDKRSSETISLGVQLLKVMATGNNVSTRSETSVVEAIETAVRKLHSHSNQDQDSAICEEDGQENSKTGYERFKEWTSLWKASGVQEQSTILSEQRGDSMPAQHQTAGVNWLGNFPSIPGSFDWQASAMCDFGMSDIMNSFPQGILDGGLDEWPRWN